MRVQGINQPQPSPVHAVNTHILYTQRLKNENGNDREADAAGGEPTMQHFSAEGP